MKSFSYVHASLIAVSLFLFWGCEESPKPQIVEAQQALDEARRAGAADVVPDLLAQAEGYFQQANDELQVQDEKFGLLRNYSESKKLLAQTTDSALQAGTKAKAQLTLEAQQVQIKNDEAKEDVIRAIQAARVALKDVKTLLTKAPEGKDAELVLEIMENDVHSAESTLAEIPKEVTPQDYAIVKEKAVEVEAVTNRVREQLLQAIRKAEGARP